MIRITLACVGRLKEDYLKRAEAEFVKRLGAYCQLETKVIMEEKMPDRVSSQEERQILQKETDRLLRIIPEHSFVILLDLRGKELSSPQFSQKLEALMVQGVSHLTFVIAEKGRFSLVLFTAYFYPSNDSYPSFGAGLSCLQDYAKRKISSLRNLPYESKS